MIKVEIIGHRGAAELEPENTIRSIIKAIECEANFVEVDIRRTKDGVLIAMHDETVDRTTNGTGKVSELTFEEIRKLDAGKGEKVPTIEEILDVTKGKVKLILELKEKGYEDQVIELIKSKNMINDVIVVSFHANAIRRIKELEPRITTGYLFMKSPFQALEIAKSCGAKILGAYYKVVNSSFIYMAKSYGFKTIVWTVNNEKDIINMIKIGVDGITSDNPCLVKKILESFI